MSELSTRLHLRRKELGLSQEELAQRMGYRSKSSITKLEKGINDLPQSKVEELAAALDTVPVSLAGESIPQWFDKLGQRIRFVRFQDGRGCYGRIWGQGVFPSQDYAHQLLHSGYSGLVSINGLSTRYQEDPAAADRRNRAAVLAMLSGKEESSLWI